MIAARIDLLPEDARRILHDAAVIGRTAWSGALRELSGFDGTTVESILAGLVRTQLVQTSVRSTLEGECEVRFSHALVQDVAYSHIPRTERVKQHMRAAAWLDEQGAREDRAELLAHHYSTALRLSRELGADTGEIAGPALAAHVAAGRQADAVNSYEAAARHYAAASELTAPDDPERAGLLLAHAVAAFRSGAPDAYELLRTAFDAHVAAGGLVVCCRGRPTPRRLES